MIVWIEYNNSTSIPISENTTKNNTITATNALVKGNIIKNIRQLSTKAKSIAILSILEGGVDLK